MPTLEGIHLASLRQYATSVLLYALVSPFLLGGTQFSGVLAIVPPLRALSLV